MCRNTFQQPYSCPSVMRSSQPLDCSARFLNCLDCRTAKAHHISRWHFHRSRTPPVRASAVNAPTARLSNGAGDRLSGMSCVASRRCQNFLPASTEADTRTCRCQPGSSRTSRFSASCRTRTQATKTGRSCARVGMR